MNRFTWRTAASAAIFLAALAAPAAAQVPVPLMYDPTPSDLRIPAPPEARMRPKASAAQATFQVNFQPAGSTGVYDEPCIAWPAQAQTAFLFAANVWASQLQSSVPIVVDACFSQDLGQGVLGAAGPTTFAQNFANAPNANTFYPIALANALAGSDRNGTDPEMVASFNSKFPFYYGTDGNTPRGTVDFVSVVMHEIGHGLGFSGSMEVGSGVGSWGFGGRMFIYDRFTQNAASQQLTNLGIFANPSAALAAALQSNGVFFNAPNASAANGGRVPLYAPTVWEDGSSYSHLAESFNNTANALMTYALSGNESIHDPGPVTLGMLRDLGWQLQNTSTTDLALSHTVDTNPAAAGKDAVFTMTVTNSGPGTATGIAVTASYDPAASVIWASPGCARQGASAVYVCNLATLANGASARFRLVLRKGSAGTLTNNVTVGSATADGNAANNTVNLAIGVNPTPAGVPVQRYRLYSPITLEHHFTTSVNEYNVLGTLTGTWVQEGPSGKVLDNPGSFNGVAAVPYYRLYCTANRWHHWTTEANEYYTLLDFPCWNGEGVDGYVLPSLTAGATELYRVVLLGGTGLHHWTIDANEVNVLTTIGWALEPGGGYLIQ
jgi:uncharacterized repeat protein (TIGR01451 family)